MAQGNGPLARVAFFFSDALEVLHEPGCAWVYSAADSQMVAETLRGRCFAFGIGPRVACRPAGHRRVRMAARRFGPRRCNLAGGGRAIGTLHAAA